MYAVCRWQRRPGPTRCWTTWTSRGWRTRPARSTGLASSAGRLAMQTYPFTDSTCEQREEAPLHPYPHPPRHRGLRRDAVVTLPPHPFHQGPPSSLDLESNDLSELGYYALADVKIGKHDCKNPELRFMAPCFGRKLLWALLGASARRGHWRRVCSWSVTRQQPFCLFWVVNAMCDGVRQERTLTDVSAV